MFQDLIEKLTRHEDLTADEAAAAMADVMEGRAAPAHIAALLIGLAMKGERPVEIVGLARTMRAHAVQVSRRYDDLLDTCGTGGGRGADLHHPAAGRPGPRARGRARGEPGQPAAPGPPPRAAGDEA